MDTDVSTEKEQIRKIEDIIDIQNAKGNFSSRQVAFNLPAEIDAGVCAKAKSLDSGLSKTKHTIEIKKKAKKLRYKLQKSPLSDVYSWPSDSDITVLRMKLCLKDSDLKKKVGDLIPGDGLHLPDSSSMVNLATLIRQSQTPSKQSIVEELLMPLSSWEGEIEKETEKDEKGGNEDCPKPFSCEYRFYEAMCSRMPKDFISTKDESQSYYSGRTTKSKMARFLRLYFCPCCTCLYNLEKTRDEPSIYISKS